MTECEMMEKFLNENTDILLKYMMWKEYIMEPQVMNSNVDVEAEDVDFITLNDPGDEMNGTSGKSNMNYGVND